MENKESAKENKEKKEITTIKLEKQTKARLDKLKEHKKESYNQVIGKLLNILSVFRKNPVLGNKILKHIETSRMGRERYTEVYQEEKTQEKSL